jgi:asparagine synthetase B (glutamine-hydrolysing)
MAMAHSVEGRYPFLDYRLVEFAAKLPSNLKMKVLDQKHLLKHAAQGLIPASIQKRHKQPYRAPDGKSFFTGKRDYVEHVLCPETIEEHGIFNSPAGVWPCCEIQEWAYDQRERRHGPGRGLVYTASARAIQSSAWAAVPHP